jgi:hypothetical protein
MPANYQVGIFSDQEDAKPVFQETYFEKITRMREKAPPTLGCRATAPCSSENVTSSEYIALGLLVLIHVAIWKYASDGSYSSPVFVAQPPPQRNRFQELLKAKMAAERIQTPNAARPTASSVQGTPNLMTRTSDGPQSSSNLDCVYNATAFGHFQLPKQLPPSFVRSGIPSVPGPQNHVLSYNPSLTPIQQTSNAPGTSKNPFDEPSHNANQSIAARIGDMFAMSEFTMGVKQEDDTIADMFRASEQLWPIASQVAPVPASYPVETFPLSPISTVPTTSESHPLTIGQNHLIWRSLMAKYIQKHGETTNDSRNPHGHSPPAPFVLYPSGCPVPDSRRVVAGQHSGIISLPHSESDSLPSPFEAFFEKEAFNNNPGSDINAKPELPFIKDEPLSPRPSSSNKRRLYPYGAPNHTALPGSFRVPDEPIFTVASSNGDPNGSYTHVFGSGDDTGDVGDGFNGDFGSGSGAGGDDGNANGEGSGSGSGRRGSGEDREEHDGQRPKKLPLACHFCRRRKLK